MPRDLKDPEGCRFSSLRKMLLEGAALSASGVLLAWWDVATHQPAARDMAVDGIRGVSIQSGCGSGLGA
jgi:hypothetical protein